MTKDLAIISSELVSKENKHEIDAVINQIIETSKQNMDEICDLTFECTALLASAQNRSTALSNQSVFRRLVGTVTGSNRKLQNAILQDNTNALYASQCIINRVMNETINNRKLALAINDRVNDMYLELKEGQNDLAQMIKMNRQIIVKFYQDFQSQFIEQERRIKKVEEFAGSICPICHTKLENWQRICPHCGNIHPLKTDKTDETTMETLRRLSKIVKSKDFSEEVVWDETAKRVERVLRKVNLLATVGKIPGYTKDIAKDIESLMYKCRDAEFQIAVVGVMKAGKSFLMNALIGEPIASVEVNPETAALTKFRSAKNFYVKVKFHTEKQWKKLKTSAQQSTQSGKDSLKRRLQDKKTLNEAGTWVDHEDVVIQCDNLHELQKQVKEYTSTQTIKHLFVSEVEVGIDRRVFNMPPEVVFVDTPGLKDPVTYRSDITRDYIRKADAVLIALKPGPLTTEGLEVVSTVLDCTDIEKAYIVGTHKDHHNELECKKYKHNWINHLVDSKRYPDERKALSRIFLTSAKMELYLNKWISLDDSQKSDSQCFTDEEYNDLQSYASKVLHKRGVDLMNLSDADVKQLRAAAGIETLKDRLEKTLISNSRKLKLQDIEKTYLRCKNQLLTLSKESVKEKQLSIELAKLNADGIQDRIEVISQEKDKMIHDNTGWRNQMEILNIKIKKIIDDLEKWGK